MVGKKKKRGWGGRKDGLVKATYVFVQYMYYIYNKKRQRGFKLQ